MMDELIHKWLAEYRAGDSDALGRVVEHVKRPLFGFILKMANNPGVAEDVFQEVWFKAIRNLDQYRDKRFLSWLFRIAHNLLIDRIRREKPIVDLHSPENEGEDPLESRIASPGLDPASVTQANDLGSRIRKAVGSLPEEQKEVFLLRMEGDIPFKDIAGIQGCSINTALARMRYALEKLRNILKDEYAGWR